MVSLPVSPSSVIFFASGEWVFLEMFCFCVASVCAVQTSGVWCGGGCGTYVWAEQDLQFAALICSVLLLCVLYKPVESGGGGCGRFIRVWAVQDLQFAALLW